MTLRRALCVCAVVAAGCGDLLDKLDLPDKVTDGGPDGSAGGDDGGGVGASGDGGGITSRRVSRVVSVAPSYTLVDERYAYRPRTNSTSSRSFSLVEAPSGMALRRGQLEWTPTADQAGSHRVVLRGDGDEAYGQEFTVKVSTSTLIAEGDVPTEGGSVYAASPRATLVRGAGVTVSPGGLTRGARLTVSELDEAPPLPNSVGSLRAVRFGPSGTVFSAPATITLPLPETGAVGLSKAALSAYVYDPSGRWRRAQILSVDLDNRVMTARARHFSIYTAAQSALELEAQLLSASAQSDCEGALMAQAAVRSELSEVAVGSVNNLDPRLAALAGLDGSVQVLLGLPGFSGSLRAAQVFELVDAQGGSEVPLEQRMIVNTLYLPGDGSATITHADALGNALGVKRYAQPLLELPDIAARLRGAATAARFSTLPGPGLALATRIHLLYFAGDASLDPLSVDDLGLATVERAAVSLGDGAAMARDGDCDGLLDEFDGSDDRLVPRIAAEPLSLLTLLPGESATLRARLVNGAPTATTEWVALVDEASDPSLLVAVEGDASARFFRASLAGRYTVLFVARDGDERLEQAFTIDVLDRPEVNTPPTCTPSKDISIGRVGQSVALTAVTSDAESGASALRVEWGAVDPNNPTALIASPALIARGDSALFAPTTSGSYTLGCRAYDGQVYGPVGAVSLTMVAADVNRRPVDLTLSPRYSSIAPGASVTLRASATDPDGDVLTFTWESFGAGGDQLDSEPGTSAFRVTTEASGTVKVVVSVSDGKSNPLSAIAELLVGEPPTSTIDFDRDGWPAGQGSLADCDDKNPATYPTARELCGDRADNDCDGAFDEDCAQFDGGTTAGTTDGSVTVPIDTFADGGTAACPGLPEICNRTDDDCDGLIDDGIVCECTTFEVCDNKIDDDCNGFIDGRDPQCCVFQGVEVCNDGIDNDCDLLVDGADTECFAADAGTSSMTTEFDASVPK